MMILRKLCISTKQITLSVMNLQNKQSSQSSQITQQFSSLTRSIVNNQSSQFMFNRNMYGFAFMALFEKNKTPEQLSPVFKRKTKFKQYTKHKKNNRIVSCKKTQKRKLQKPKLTNHRGMLKRVKLVGPSWNRQFKFKSPGKYHLRRNKTSSNLRRKDKARYIHKHDIKRVRKLIPYFKRKSLKARY